jgi:cytochrome b561
LRCRRLDDVIGEELPVSWFKLFQFPDLVTPMSRPSIRCTTCIICQVLVGVAVLHVAGALKHHFIDRNDVLKRMLPFGGIK